MKKGPLGLSGQQAGRLTMFLVTDALVQEWNTAIAARKGYFLIDYTAHSPVLLVGAANCTIEPWLILDTRAKKMIRRALKQDALALMTDDITARLAKHQALLQFVYRKERDGRKVCTLQFAATGGNSTAAALVHQHKGLRSAPFGLFELPSSWNATLPKE